MRSSNPVTKRDTATRTFTFRPEAAMLDGDKSGRELSLRMVRWWPLLLAAVLLLGAGSAASMAQLPLSRATVGQLSSDRLELPPEKPAGTAPAPPKTLSVLEVPSWVYMLLIGVAAAIMLTLIVLLLTAGLRAGSRFRRKKVLRPKEPAPSKVEQVDAEVVAALDAGLLQLDEVDADPRRAVIACWVRLEGAAAAAGTGRQPGDTATDLVLRLLTGHRLSEPVLTGFADVYREARYATRHEVDERMRAQAKTALSRLRGELTGVPV